MMREVRWGRKESRGFNEKSVQNMSEMVTSRFLKPQIHKYWSVPKSDTEELWKLYKTFENQEKSILF